MTDTERNELAEVECQSCGYVHRNGPSNWLNLSPGDYCPKCGTELSETEFEDSDDLGGGPGNWKIVNPDADELFSKGDVDD